MTGGFKANKGLRIAIRKNEGGIVRHALEASHTNRNDCVRNLSKHQNPQFLFRLYNPWCFSLQCFSLPSPHPHLPPPSHWLHPSLPLPKQPLKPSQYTQTTTLSPLSLPNITGVRAPEQGLAFDPAQHLRGAPSCSPAPPQTGVIARVWIRPACGGVVCTRIQNLAMI